MDTESVKVGGKVEGQIVFIFSRLRLIRTVTFGSNPPGSPLKHSWPCTNPDFWMYVDISEFWAGQMIRPSPRVGGWRWGCHFPAWPFSPGRWTHSGKFLPLSSLPSDAANPRFLAKITELKRNCLNAHRNFSPRGPRGVYDSNSWVLNVFTKTFGAL